VSAVVPRCWRRGAIGRRDAARFRQWYNRDVGSTDPESIDAVKSLVRGAGLRCTAARLAVMQHMLGATGPATHAEVSESLADRGFDRATIYRNLTELTEAKLLTRVDLGDHVWRFDAKRHHDGHGSGEDHPHFVCTSCGEVSCLDDVTVAISQRPGKAPADGGGKKGGKQGAKKKAGGGRQSLPAVTEVLLKGTCENCE
jgi:Fur family ferric uptake transcriptional regulator